MTQYALISGRVPMTLLPEGKKCGVIPNEERYGFVFHNYSSFIEEIDQIIKNDEYLRKKESLIKDAVVGEDSFNNNLNRILTEGKTSYSLDLTPVTLVNPVPSKNAVIEAIAKKNHRKLIKVFPLFFILRSLSRLGGS